MTAARATISLFAAGLLAAGTACSGSAEPAGPPAAPASSGHAGHTGGAGAPPPQPLREGERFVEVGMARQFSPAPARGTDEYRCFLIDPGVAAGSFITGSQFLPGNAAIVHHAIFFRLPAAAVAEAKKLDERADGDGWTCFGGPGVGNEELLGQSGGGGGAAWIGAWAPGGDEVVLGQDIGYELPAGSQIVLQVHYNVLSAKGSDRSAMRLRIKDGGGAPLEPLHTMLLPAPVELPCAPDESGPLCDRDQAIADVKSRFGAQAGFLISGLSMVCGRGKLQPGPVQSCTRPVRTAGVVHAVAGHMHLLGRSIKVELNPGTPKAKVLLDEQVYNFDDQGARILPEPIAVKAGDELRVTCTHDVALRRMVPALKMQEPRYVVWGEGTADEMCLGIVSWTRA